MSGGRPRRVKGGMRSRGGGGGSGMPRWGRPTSVEDKARSMTKSNDGEEEDKRLVAQRGEETGGIISSPSIGRRPTTTAL